MELCPLCGQPVKSNNCLECKGENFRFILGDSRQVLLSLDEEFDAVITDPPYNTGSTVRDVLTPSTKKYVSSGSKYENFPAIAFDGIPEEEWERLIVSVFRLAFERLKPGGLVAVFSDWRRLNKMASLISMAGIQPKGVLVWDKTRGSRPIKGGFNLQTEFIIWGRKPGERPNFYAAGLVTKATLTKKQHITQKPIEVIEHILSVIPKGGVILDPFAGVATTGVAAIKNGYKFIGVEVVPEYHQIGCERLSRIKN